MFGKLINSIRLWWYHLAPVAQAPTQVPVAPTEPTPQLPRVGNHELWYPKAVKGGGMRIQGKYAKLYPQGAIVHFTAGHCDTEQDAQDSLAWGKEQGYAFFVIGPKGVVYQNFPLDSWGYHAGQSSYPGLGSGVSSKLVGIEVACAGMVDSNGKSWFKKIYHNDRIRTVPKRDNRVAGRYVKYTPEQEKALIDLIVWLKKNNPLVFDIKYVLGHDEVSVGRKDDPGGSLSMTMPEFRKHIESLID